MGRLEPILLSIQRFSDRPWYPLLVALFAGLDHWIFVVPTDGLVVSGVLLAPRRWLRFALLTAIFSTLGAISFTYAIGMQGEAYLEMHWPELVNSEAWIWSEKFLGQFGLFLVFAVGAAPMAAQPFLIAALFAEIPFESISWVYFTGRVLKYFFLCALAARAPAYLSRLWGIQRELRQSGVKPEKPELSP